jgi:CheY-like chemotaxis protein
MIGAAAATSMLATAMAAAGAAVPALGPLVPEVGATPPGEALGDVRSPAPDAPHLPRDAAQQGQALSLRMLVVDDDATNRRVNSRLLARLGYSSDTVSDGDDVAPAIDSADAAGVPFDGILMDIIMKRVHGTEACNALRRAGYGRPIIAATGNATERDTAQYLCCGFSAVLAKPFNVAALAEVLQAVGLPAPARAPPPAAADRPVRDTGTAGAAGRLTPSGAAGATGPGGGGAARVGELSPATPAARTPQHAPAGSGTQGPHS